MCALGVASKGEANLLALSIRQKIPSCRRFASYLNRLDRVEFSANLTLIEIGLGLWVSRLPTRLFKLKIITRTQIIPLIWQVRLAALVSRGYMSIFGNSIAIAGSAMSRNSVIKSGALRVSQIRLEKWSVEKLPGLIMACCEAC